jgi:hypothetical protein
MLFGPWWFLAGCNPTPQLPTDGDWASLGALVLLPPEPYEGHRWAIDAQPDRVHRTAVLHDAQARCLDCPADCPTLPLGPLTLRRGQYRPQADLPPVDQRVEIALAPREAHLQVTRILDTPLDVATPVHWPEDWSLTVTADDQSVEPVRRGDIAWLPAATQLILAGGGSVPAGHVLNEATVTLYVADLLADLPALRTRLNVVPTAFHLELPLAQTVSGTDLLVAGVRFPEQASRDGIRVLSNEHPEPALLEQLLAWRDPLSLPRPLWVVPGPRDAYIGQRLVLSPPAHTDPTALRRALLHTQPLEASLRAAMASRLGPPPEVVDPGCFGLGSRPELDRGRLIAQLELHGPIEAATWQELALSHPALTPWLAAPRLPRVRVATVDGTTTLIDDAQTGLPLRVPLQIGEVRHVARIGEPIAVPAGSNLIIDPDNNQPFHRE